MIDLHSHILPSVDDGAVDLDMSLRIARIYVDNGYEKVIATPHFIDGTKKYSRYELLEKLEELNSAIQLEEIDLEVLPGNEIYISPSTAADVVTGKALTLNNSRYVLIELPSNDIPKYTDTVIYELQIKGYLPIISHPERNSKIIENPNMLYSMLEKGALTQMNLQSLEGMYGKSAKETALVLLRHNMIHFAASDTHSDGRRSPETRRMLKLLENKIGKENYWRIVYENPEKVIINKPITYRYAEKVKKSNGILNILSSLI